MSQSPRTPIDRATGRLLGVLGGLLALLLILTVVFFATRSCTGPEAAGETDSESATETAAPTVAVPDTVTLPETPDAGSSYQDSIIFVGDSLTAHLVSRGVLSGGTDTTQVWRTETNMLNLKPGVNTQKILLPETGEAMTIAEAAGRKKPPVMIITLGTDWGVAYLSEADFKACYAELIRDIQKASPDTRIILQSIFPVAATCQNLTNPKIDTANEWVKAIAYENDCRYLDTQSVLKDDTGCLKAEYAYEDGIHLTADAYRVILAYIRTHALTANQ